jgi:acetolactate synthase-1/2/3 large subunit
MDIAPAIRTALTAGAPVLLDVLADPDAMPPVTAFTRLSNY